MGTFLYQGPLVDFSLGFVVGFLMGAGCGRGGAWYGGGMDVGGCLCSDDAQLSLPALFGPVAVDGSNLMVCTIFWVMICRRLDLFFRIDLRSGPPVVLRYCLIILASLWVRSPLAMNRFSLVLRGS